MMLYRLGVAKQDVELLTIRLDQLGAVTKPYFLASMEHTSTSSPIPLTPHTTFFMESMREPTLAVEAIVSLGRGLEYHYIRTKSLRATLAHALALAATLQGEDWAFIAGACLGCEQEGLALLNGKNAPRK